MSCHQEYPIYSNHTDEIFYVMGSQTVVVPSLEQAKDSALRLLTQCIVIDTAPALETGNPASAGAKMGSAEYHP
jgi:hypothetical protein